VWQCDFERMFRIWTVTWIYVSHEAQKWHLSDYPFSTFHWHRSFMDDKKYARKMTAQAVEFIYNIN
jgi:hypothetical protein